MPDYARKGMALCDAERWLAPILTYDVADGKHQTGQRLLRQITDQHIFVMISKHQQMERGSPLPHLSKRVAADCRAPSFQAVIATTNMRFSRLEP
jgi:hypothetical protein